MLISFGLGESISVNAIIGLPTIKEWKIVLDVDAGYATSKLLRKKFDLTFQHASNGFPTGVEFTKDDFVRPKRATPSGLALLCRIATNSLDPTPQENNSSGVSIAVQSSMSSGITKHE